MPQERSPAGVRARAGTEETRPFVRRIRRVARRRFTPEEKVRIVLEGFRSELRASELCRRQGIRPNIYYAWFKDFMEVRWIHRAGKSRPQAGHRPGCVPWALRGDPKAQKRGQAANPGTHERISSGRQGARGQLKCPLENG